MNIQAFDSAVMMQSRQVHDFRCGIFLFMVSGEV